VDCALVENICKKLIAKLRQEDSTLTTKRGNLIEYLGITIDNRQKGKENSSMKDYNNKLLEEAPCDMDLTAKTQLTSHLFNINKDITRCHHKVKGFYAGTNTNQFKKEISRTTFNNRKILAIPTCIKL